MKKIALLILSFVSTFSFAQEYQFNVDLTQTEDDKVPVELTGIKLNKDTAKYHFPKTIPGTYATENYGVYIDDFKASDDKGNPLISKKEGENKCK